MREVKFRAWNREEKEMYYPKSLYVFEEMGIDEIKDGEWDGGCDWMQYIGLPDKNKTDIYVGDLLTSSQWEGIIEVKSLQSFFENKGFAEGEMIEDWSDVKIIGNIYSNPELRNN